MEKEKVKDDTDKINAIYQTIPTKIVIDYIYYKYAFLWDIVFWT